MDAERYHVTWEQFDAVCESLSERLLQYSPDLIIGIARGGLPAATVLSHKLSCPVLTTVTARKSMSEGPGGIAIHRPPEVRNMGWIPEEAERILLIDDVVACGDIFCAVAARVRSRVKPTAQISFACLYGDKPQITNGPYAGILPQLQIGVEIDNQKQWIVFPWERTA